MSQPKPLDFMALRAGDVVAYIQRGYSRNGVVAVIERVTDAQIILPGNVRFWRKGGRRVGEHSCQLRDPLQSDVIAARVAAEHRRIAADLARRERDRASSTPAELTDWLTAGAELIEASAERLERIVRGEP